MQCGCITTKPPCSLSSAVAPEHIMQIHQANLIWALRHKDSTILSVFTITHVTALPVSWLFCLSASSPIEKINISLDIFSHLLVCQCKLSGCKRTVCKHCTLLVQKLFLTVLNKDLYSTNQEIHNINTRSNINLHLPVCNLTLFQKGAYFCGLKSYLTTYHLE